MSDLDFTISPVTTLGYCMSIRGLRGKFLESPTTVVPKSAKQINFEKRENLETNLEIKAR